MLKTILEDLDKNIQINIKKQEEDQKQKAIDEILSILKYPKSDSNIRDNVSENIECTLCLWRCRLFLAKKFNCCFCIFNINFFDFSRKCISKRDLRYDKDAKDHIWLISWLLNFVLQSNLLSRIILCCIEEVCNSHYFLYGNGMCTLWTEYKLEWCYNVFRWQQRDFCQWRCQGNVW